MANRAAWTAPITKTNNVLYFSVFSTAMFSFEKESFKEEYQVIGAPAIL